MMVSVGMIPVLDLMHLTTRIALIRPDFVLETLALWAFGLSWLVKGGALWRDSPTAS